MRHGSPIILLLWGRHFDEIDAVIFVSELRSAGLCVKVVGLEGRPMAGTHGLVLTPDLALGQIPGLAQRAVGIVMPCALDRLLYYAHDPRLAHFLQEAQRRQVYFIIRQSEHEDEARRQWAAAMQLWLPLAPLITYPDSLQLVAFVRTLAGHFQASKSLLIFCLLSGCWVNSI